MIPIERNGYNMGIFKKTTRKMAMKLAQGEKMRQITHVIMSRSTLKDGKLYSPSGKCIGWYNQETGVGWCNMKGYKELLQSETANDDDYENYDSVDLTEYLEYEDETIQ